ncbi:MAG: cobalamin-dependent protein [Deltaproteobacteria bacterium]|nr:cobalamin-dependent protein [Deltaproteobacteria bacterium]
MTPTERPEAPKVEPTGPEPHLVKPYGDAMGDGAVQVSFSLPVPLSDESREAARRLAGKMGLTEPQVYHEADLGHGFSYFIVYGKCRHTVDIARIVVPRVAAAPMGFHEIDEFISHRLGRKVRVIGACTGSDAHTVGIDAIMNMKGFAGEYGLERYTNVETLNLGSQVPNDVLLAKALEFRADVVLVSQVVTQKDVHLTNLAELVDMVEAEGIRDRVLMICGGPRITHEVALELGLDAGFGPGTTPTRVASYFAQELERRWKAAGGAPVTR